MSFRQFLNTRTGFAGLATLVCGVSYFLGVGLAVDARLKEEREAAIQLLIEQKAKEKLQQEERGAQSQAPSPSSESAGEQRV